MVIYFFKEISFLMDKKTIKKKTFIVFVFVSSLSTFWINSQINRFRGTKFDCNMHILYLC